MHRAAIAAVALSLLPLGWCSHPAAASRAADPAKSPSLARPHRADPHRNAAPCRAADLRGQFRAGGLATGQDFGTILVRTVGRHNCRISGHVSFAAYLRSGAADRRTSTSHDLGWQPQFRGSGAAVTLRAHAGRFRGHQDPRGYLQAVLDGNERDDPRRANGLCRARDEVTPHSLVLTIGRYTVHVRNHDPAKVYTGHHGIYGCHGEIGLVAIMRPEHW
jgi:hypothetical protein